MSEAQCDSTQHSYYGAPDLPLPASASALHYTLIIVQKFESVFLVPCELGAARPVFFHPSSTAAVSNYRVMVMVGALQYCMGFLLQFDDSIL